MILYPKEYLKRVTEISYKYLQEHNIKALILDVDNTLIDYHKVLEEDIINWAKDLTEKGIILYILSNTNQEKKVKKVAEGLNIPYKFLGLKPLKIGFKKIQKELNISNENIAVVGDQIFTDVLGANRMKMYSILVEPINKKDLCLTGIKRPIENLIKKEYLKTKEK